MSKIVINPRVRNFDEVEWDSADWSEFCPEAVELRGGDTIERSATKKETGATQHVL